MLKAMSTAARLFRAGFTLIRYDALMPPDLRKGAPAPARWAGHVARLVGGTPRPLKDETDRPARSPTVRQGRRLAAALTALGPTYIKLGQFLATRADMVGPDLAEGLRGLQDRLAPFPEAEAKAVIEEDLGAPVEELFARFDAPLAAASIAQVHRAEVREGEVSGGEASRDVAVKVLRPRIEQAFARELDAFERAAGWAEGLSEEARRLKPREAVRVLKRTTQLEMDFRLEAAAASEMAENCKDDPDFRVPAVDWQRTARRVLTTEWIDGVRLSDRAGLEASNHDLTRLGEVVLQSFLTHALRDGFFHADMHPGNLFVDDEGRLVAVDFGIMGRLDKPTRRFMAETLFGFITRDYDRVARVHFEAGYVPPTHAREDFRLALRSIGEPIWGRPAAEVSMARVLQQLFEVTRLFDMPMQPSLILLQKTMVVVEGVARDLDPETNFWEVSRPVLEQWLIDEVGPEARLREAGDAVAALGRIAARAPETLAQVERAAELVAQMADGKGVKLDPETAVIIGESEARANRSGRWALWVLALAAVAGAAALWWG